MAYAIGVILFALGILVSVALHEAGHMFSARAFGMKVSRYFIGFGPTLFSFRRGEVEYGLKAIPAGAFVKIDGMTPLEEAEEVKPEDRHRVFWRKPVWQRTIVLVAGSVTHFVLAFVIFWVAAAFVGVPNPKLADYQSLKVPAQIGQTAACVQVKYDAANPEKCTPADPKGPAKAAGLKAGDTITKIGGTPTPTYEDLVRTTQHTKAGPVPVTYIRDGRSHTTTVTLVTAQRPTGGTTEHPTYSDVSVLGITLATSQQMGIPTTVSYGPVEGVAQAGQLYAQTAVGMGHAVVRIPEKIPNLVTALAGEKRSADTPISVVGASRLGGQAGELHAWWFFLLLLAQLNLFIGVFNLLPLLPLDGGHVVIAWFEKLRSWWASRRGRADPGRVDYLKLMPITYAVVIVFGGLSVLTVAADIINPVTLN
ncbi:M50 family metallopeptidase [Actinocatenispora rupis]|uniref:Zinc metalloprotease Rip1 n=1 Tax=Actinocatenispora rupis TaxID=519421 RepID=A0A8J3J0B6_9ACTN|nr:site-2 protease family protein [Actinocatenispora rupis]GID09151.1 zinc metalloprotease Rip1 [Actinocatenispora rupis]